MSNKYIASVSFGKDSLAMLFMIINSNMPLDEVVFYDTGMEFEAIYKIRDYVKDFVERRNIKFTELKPECDFCYKMFNKPVVERKKPHAIHYGYSWCGGMCRWGTSDKICAIDKYCKDSIQYVGIAYDEQERLKKERKPNKIFPLNELQMTEADCLAFCRKLGFSWVEEEENVDLYDILDRVSCWCCRNKNILELYNYWRYLHKYWDKLKKLQDRTKRPFKPPYTIYDLEEKFLNHKTGKKIWKYLYKAKNKQGE